MFTNRITGYPAHYNIVSMEHMCIIYVTCVIHVCIIIMYIGMYVQTCLLVVTLSNAVYL